MLNRLTARVGKMKQVLEDILNDDQEMEDMYLGRRAGRLPALPTHLLWSKTLELYTACTFLLVLLGF